MSAPKSHNSKVHFTLLLTLIIFIDHLYCAFYILFKQLKREICFVPTIVLIVFLIELITKVVWACVSVCVSVL